MRKSKLDLFFLKPIQNFIEKKTSVGIVLFLAAMLAMVVANSSLSTYYFSFLDKYISFGVHNFQIKKNILHWINDGLMSMFFFLVGLELKREILEGELSSFRDSLLPAFAALGGMLVPALIYTLINHGTPGANGWGIPMATDIAFALGILYLLGDKVPLSLKVFLTAVAIVDDIGAILVIALFYTEEIAVQNLYLGASFMVFLIIGNILGIRNTLYYALFGIGGVWLAILLSGVHATIAAVLVAFTIPANRKVHTGLFLRKIRLMAFKIGHQHDTMPLNKSKLSSEIEKITLLTYDASPPLHRLEHSFNSFVSFVVLPVFAFANAGVVLGSDVYQQLMSSVTLGVVSGLIVGKVVGITLFTFIMVKLRICHLPHGVDWPKIMGVGLLAAIGFTMSVFITDLAFKDEQLIKQAKLGILAASSIAGVFGYYLLKGNGRKEVGSLE
ncbi:Na+/H+ antiporter NhaA [Flavobacterium orientale]|nr:Na+/H+ antiporter NhaA [Flavobacterium orientale]